MHTHFDEQDEMIIRLIVRVSLHLFAGILYAMAVLTSQSILTARIACSCFTILMIVDIYYVLKTKKELKSNER